MKKFLIVAASIFVVLAVVFGLLVAISTKIALFNIFLTLSPTSTLLTKTNILIVGADGVTGQRSDTIMVLHTNPASKEVTLISIPRDTLAVLPGRGLDKINHAYAYGGIEYSKKTVETLLGIEIPYYVTINLTGIVDLIDQLGGVTIDVENRMYYVDYAGDLFIDLQPGIQKLNGKQLMGYLRFRRDGGDFKRIDRQQKFLRSMGQELMSRENLLRSPKMFLDLLSYIDTNLNPKETLGLALLLRSAQELGNVQMATVPGNDTIVDGIYYLRVDEDRLRDIVKQYIIDK
ncbi:MAG: LCP family protein [Candidatus Margulisiibacteriota bacterium]